MPYLLVAKWAAQVAIDIHRLFHDLFHHQRILENTPISELST